MIKIVNLERNYGVANARNMAVEKATGDFVLFVDSDDWVETNIVEELITLQNETDSDIVSCNTLSHKKNKVSFGNTFDSLNPDPLINIVQRKAAFHLWGRLIRKKIYTENHIQCKVGVNQGEDLQTFPQLAYFAKKHVCVNKALYHYKKMFYKKILNHSI
jgi:glycosyltransferase involved in cell wall biosynthesis